MLNHFFYIYSGDEVIAELTKPKPRTAAQNESVAKRKSIRNRPKPKESQPPTWTVSTRGVNQDFQSFAGELDSNIDTCIL